MRGCPNFFRIILPNEKKCVSLHPVKNNKKWIMQDLMPVNGLFEMTTLPYEARGTIVSKDTLSVHYGNHLKVEKYLC
jgi:hypothetical protein